MNLKIIEFQQFPSYTTPDTEKGSPGEISEYLQMLFEEKGNLQEEGVKIPCLMDLAAFFKTTVMDVYEAFQNLRSKGFDYELPGIDGSVTFWYCSPSSPLGTRH